MELKFENLPEAKKIKIINAALEIFAKEGYTKASTNKIVDAAEISKGALFHYFKNKKQLYLYLYDYCMTFVLTHFYSQLDPTIDDFIDFLAHSGEIKMAIHGTHPQIFQFIQNAYYDPIPELESEIYKKSQSVLVENSGKMFAHIDYNKFREELNLEMVINTILLCFEGLINQMVQQAKIKKRPLNYNEVVTFIEPYYHFLKQVYYKPEYVQSHKEAL